MKNGKSRWPVLAVALLLTVAACSKKSSGSSSGGGPAGGGGGGGAPVTPASPNYTGAWSFGHKALTGDYTCDTATMMEKGIADVDAAGNFSFGRNNDPAVVYSGQIDTNSGAVSFSVSGLGTCGPLSGSGTCSSDSSCTGTYTGNGYTGEFQMVR